MKIHPRWCNAGRARRLATCATVLIEREIEIQRPVDEVFDFLLDARNDPDWCHKVQSVELVSRDGPGTGARYRVVHKPV